MVLNRQRETIRNVLVRTLNLSEARLSEMPGPNIPGRTDVSKTKECGCRSPKQHRDCAYCGYGGDAQRICGVCKEAGIDGPMIPGTGRRTCAQHKGKNESVAPHPINFDYKSEHKSPEGYEVQSYNRFGDPSKGRGFTLWPPKGHGNAVGNYDSVDDAREAIEQWKLRGNPADLKRDGGAQFKLNKPHGMLAAEAKLTFKSVAKKHGYEKGDETDTKEFGHGEIWYHKSGTQNGHVFLFQNRAVHQAKGMEHPLFNNPETHVTTPEALDKHLSRVAPKTEAANREPMPSLRKRAKDATANAKRVNTPEAHRAAAALHKECGDRMCDTLSARGQGYSATMGAHGDLEYWHNEQAKKLEGKK